MGLINEFGSFVAEYTYDAWGKVLTAVGTMAEINPLRYRGYYYDTETGFYYLQSRYYDPELHRFINADSFASTGQGFVGANMFAYCLNNPTNLADETGNAPGGRVTNTIIRDGGGFSYSVQDVTDPQGPNVNSFSTTLLDIIKAEQKNGKKYVRVDVSGGRLYAVYDESDIGLPEVGAGVTIAYGVETGLSKAFSNSGSSGNGLVIAIIAEIILIAAEQGVRYIGDVPPNGEYWGYAVTSTYKETNWLDMNHMEIVTYTSMQVYIYYEDAWGINWKCVREELYFVDAVVIPAS